MDRAATKSQSSVSLAFTTGARWQYITINRVADDEFTAEWVAANASAIFIAFGLNH